jgi:hypothetical protein
MKPYLSIDVETTGINVDKVQILQLAAIWDDGRPLNELATFNCLVDNGYITYGEHYALQMNHSILERIANKPVYKAASEEGIPILTLEEAKFKFRTFVMSCNNNKALFVAGKNAAGFDIPILKNNRFQTSLFKHRVIDPGSLYLPDFGHPPSLPEINQLLGLADVSHDALDDCFNVIKVIRHKMQK